MHIYIWVFHNMKNYYYKLMYVAVYLHQSQNWHDAGSFLRRANFEF